MKKILLILLAIIALTGSAYATDTIVDTGTPNATGGGKDLALNANSWWAGNFTITNPYTLTSIEGYLKADNGNKIGTITLSLYSGSGFPSVANPTYQTQMNVTNTTYTWDAVSGLNWNVAAGEYWIAFERKDTDTFTGKMLKLGTPSPAGTAPFDSYAKWTTGASYVNDTDKFIGARVYGNITPEPISSALFLIGGTALAAWQIRRKKKHNS